MTRRQIAGARALVTGASSGIGFALARELARQGARLLLTARRSDRLQSLAAELANSGTEAISVTGDITDSGLRAELRAAATAHFGGLDILVNNAGVGALGPFASAEAARLRRIMEVNFFAPVELTRDLLPLLVTGTSPLIVNMGSVLGHRAVPNKSEYCASKFALHGFSDALRAELVRPGIDVLLVSPSTTQSEFFQSVLEGTGAPSKTARGMPAETVARRVVRAMRSGRQEIILSSGGKLLVWLDRLCPPLMNRLVARFG